MSVVVHEGTLLVTPPPAYVGVPLSVVLCLLAFVLVFRDRILVGWVAGASSFTNKIVEAGGGIAGQIVKLSTYSAFRLSFRTGAWKCSASNDRHERGELTRFENLHIYRIRQHSGKITNLLEGTCTVCGKKWDRIIGAGDLKSAGVPIDIEPRPAREKQQKQTFIDPRIKAATPTKKIGGSLVTGYGISPAVANQMQEMWPKMSDFVQAKKKEVKDWKDEHGVRPALDTLWSARNDIKEHVARPASSPARAR